MRFIKTILHHVAYTERKITNKELIPTLLSLEKQVYIGGLYKNGPIMMETNFSDFFQSGEYLSKFYIPLNERIVEENGLSYLEQVVLDRVLSYRVPFNKEIFDELDKVKKIMLEQELRHVDNKLYLTFYPVFQELWVDIHIPFKEK